MGIRVAVLFLCIFYSNEPNYKKTSIFAGAGDDIYALPTISLNNTKWISTIDDSAVTLKRGVAIVLYTSAECPIAKKYRPELLRIQKEVHTKAVSWLFVYPTEDKATASSTFRASGLNGISVFEPGYALAKQCSVRVTPTALVFDATGKLRYRGRIDDRTAVMGEWKPTATRRDLYLALKEVLSGTAVTRPQTDANGCFLPFVIEN